MAATTEDFAADEVVGFLSRPASYADHPRSVEVVETHISWVFLTERHAYKLKKPVKFDFLDFSTAELRRERCQDELRLNRRLAADVYLEVLPVTRESSGGLALAGRGAAVDWVVQMRRLPADRAVDVMLESGRLKNSDATLIAERLATFYAGLPPAPVAAESYRGALEHRIRENRAELIDALSDERTRVLRVIGAQLQYLHAEADVFDRRVGAGRIVDGHGDLRPEHIYLTDPPAIIDCIEFSDELRQVDVADELSFLAMECDRLGDGGLGDAVVRTCERVCKDEIARPLFNFYRSYRACVRAKVAAIRAEQEPADGRRAMVRLARQYLNWAERYADETGRRSLVVVGGLLGTGKSSLAGRLAEAIGAELLSTDHIRQAMLGPSGSPAGYGEGAYEPRMRERIYDAMFGAASELLCQGRSVILDGTFLVRARRQRAYELGRRHNAATVYVECRCPRETALARIEERAGRGGGESEARAELYDLQAAEFEPPYAAEPAVAVETTDDISQQMRAVFDRLRGLLVG